MAREKVGTGPEPGPGERVGRDEIYGKAGDPTESLSIAASVFGEPLRPVMETIIDFLKKGEGVFSASVTLKIEGDPQDLSLVIAAPSATRHLAVEFSADLARRTDVPSGTPLKANYSGKFYLINPISGEPFAKPNDLIPPEGRIGTGAIGKASLKEGSIWGIRVPGDIRRGVRFLGYAATDGQIVGPDTVLYYFEKVKEVK